MKAGAEELSALRNLQQIDLSILRLKKQFDELPQRGLIEKARAKRAAIQEKLAKVAALKKDASGRLMRINDEDSSLEAKAAEVQRLIDETSGDFRNLEARTKELAGIAKRRETLAEDREKANDDLAKIAALEAQVSQAIAQIDAAQEQASETFQAESGKLREGIGKLEDAREEEAARISSELLALYDKTASRCGGVAVGELKDDKCSVCRMTIEAGRLIDLRAQAPLGVCPNCKRLLTM